MADPKPLDPLVKKTFLNAASGIPAVDIQVREYGKGKKQARYQKVLFWGDSATGKTYVIIGLLELGLKVFVLSTDFGGSGLETVINTLEARGREDLLENLKEVELNTYEKVEAFTKNPVAGYSKIYDFDPDVLVWDGFSGWQNGQLDDYVLSMAAQGRVGELREAGLFAVEQDWGGIKRGTLHNLNRFLMLHNTKTGKLWHKVVTALAAEKAQEYGSTVGEKRQGPMIQGGAKKLIEAGFNIIGKCIKKKGKDGFEYFYEFNADDRTVAKQRAYGLSNIEPADMKALWPKIVKPQEVAK